MSPPGRQSRPAGNGPAGVDVADDRPIISLGTDTKAEALAYVADLRRRRAASWRLLALECGHRDPIDCHRVVDNNLVPWPPVVASTFGLTPIELAAEAAKLQRLGWSPGEIRLRLDLRAAA